MKGQKPHFKSVTTGLAISVLLLFVISFYNSVAFGEIFLHDALPHYGRVMALTPLTPLTQADFETQTTQETPLVWDVIVDMDGNNPALGLIGLDDVGVDFSTNYEDLQLVLDTLHPRLFGGLSDEALRDPAILRSAMYTVDDRTLFVPELFKVDNFIAADLRVSPQSVANGDPVVLIFHTHSTEMFVDSNPGDMFTGIVGVGDYLARLLNARGIPTMHYYAERFDMVDDKPHILGAYERQEKFIKQVLQDNPSIEVVIDIHRDGIENPAAPLLVTQINGQSTARLMFVNGISTRNVNGVAVPVNNLPNPNLIWLFLFKCSKLWTQAIPGLTAAFILMLSVIACTFCQSPFLWRSAASAARSNKPQTPCTRLRMLLFMY
jgi:hypothetical protein